MNPLGYTSSSAKAAGNSVKEGPHQFLVSTFTTVFVFVSLCRTPRSHRHCWSKQHLRASTSQLSLAMLAHTGGVYVSGLSCLLIIDANLRNFCRRLSPVFDERALFVWPEVPESSLNGVVQFEVRVLESRRVPRQLRVIVGCMHVRPTTWRIDGSAQANHTVRTIFVCKFDESLHCTTRNRAD